MRATLEGEVGKYRAQTSVELVFSTIFDLLPDAFFQLGKALTEMEENLGQDGTIDFNPIIQTHRCFSCI